MACVSVGTAIKTPRENLINGSRLGLWGHADESPSTATVENELCEVDFLVNELVRGTNDGVLNTSKQSLKKVKSNKSLIKTPARPSSLNVSIADLLDDDQPISTPVHGKSAIDDVFSKYMDEDPYASIGKFLPRNEKKSPEKPLTLFSPDEKKVTRYQVNSAPQRRHRGKLISENRPIDFNITEGCKLPDAKRELRFSPFAERRLQTSAYSPLNSPRFKRQPFDNLTLRRRLNEVQLNRLVPPAGCSTPLQEDKSKFQPSPLSQAPDDSFTLYDGSSTSIHHTPKLGHGSFPAYYHSPVVHIPEDVKTSILLGITCYVEVRYNKEDKSEVVQKELLSLGAKVEKNFTKKVTHVIFKEGKISTFMKAKEQKIPLVSILWIEACKLARGLVNPEQFAPTDNEKYLKEIPNEEDRRTARFLRRGQAFLDRLNGVLPRRPQRQRANTKMATTNGRQKKSKESVIIKGGDGRGRKKLIFNSDASNGVNGKKPPDVDSDYGSDSESNDHKEDRKRRSSAPGAVGEVIGHQKKLTSFFQTNYNKRKNDDDDVQILTTPPKLTGATDSQEKALSLLTGGYSSKNSKRIKLFNPDEQTEFDSFPSTPVALSPFIKNTPPSKRVRTTRSGSSKKKTTSALNSKPLTRAKKSLVPLMEHEEDMNRSSAHNSMSYFDLDKKASGGLKCELRIAFTGLRKEEMDDLRQMITDLGTFKIDPNVTKKTTHLVTSSPAKRTVNLLKALAQGCWILDDKWIKSSKSNGKWMLEEQFELKSFSDAVTACRLERQAFGKDYSMDLFSGCGRIFVDSSVQPPRSDLIDLLKLCCARVVSISTSADIIVSLCPPIDNYSQVTIVNPKWVLDSITQNNLLDKDQYKL